MDLPGGTFTVGGRTHTFERPQHARTALQTVLYEDWHAGMAPPPKEPAPGARSAAAATWSARSSKPSRTGGPASPPP